MYSEFSGVSLFAHSPTQKTAHDVKNSRMETHNFLCLLPQVLIDIDQQIALQRRVFAFMEEI